MITFKKGTLLNELVNTFTWDVEDGSYRVEDGTISLTLHTREVEQARQYSERRLNKYSGYCIEHFLIDNTWRITKLERGDWDFYEVDINYDYDDNGNETLSWCEVNIPIDSDTPDADACFTLGRKLINQELRHHA